MKVRIQYDVLDPDVQPEDPNKVLELEPDPDAPDDAYTIGADGNTVRAPDGSAAAEIDDAPKPWVKPLAVVLAITFVGLTAWNVQNIVVGPPPPPPASETQIKQTLYLGVMRIEQYRRDRGVTPDRLTDADLPPGAGYTYQRLDPWHYSLAFESGGSKLEYDSKVPRESFFGSPRTLLTMGENQ